jgi:hypothetical protein
MADVGNKGMGVHGGQASVAHFAHEMNCIKIADLLK